MMQNFIIFCYEKNNSLFYYILLNFFQNVFTAGNLME